MYHHSMSRAYRELVEAHPEIYGILDDGLQQWKQQVEQWAHEEERQLLKDEAAKAEFESWLDTLNGRTR